MKYEYDKELKCRVGEAETVLEAVETLEDFLCCDFGQKDWSLKFLHTHFKICKDEIKKIQTGGNKMEEEGVKKYKEKVKEVINKYIGNDFYKEKILKELGLK